MKNRILIVLIATIINMGMFAQSKSDSLKVMKNEIGVNLIPLFTINNQSNEYTPTFNVFYKRALKNNWHGRVSLIYFGNYSDGQIYIEKIKGLPNSKLSIDYTQNFSYDYFQYNLGIEKRFGKRKVKMFTGLDVGYANQKAEDFKMYSIRDSITNNSVGYDPKSSGFQNQTDSVVSHFKKTSNAIILTPFYGMMFNISKHFFFSAQAGLALSIVNENRKSLINNTTPIRITNFDFNLNSVSSNFSICYRF